MLLHNCFNVINQIRTFLDGALNASSSWVIMVVGQMKTEGKEFQILFQYLREIKALSSI